MGKSKRQIRVERTQAALARQTANNKKLFLAAFHRKMGNVSMTCRAINIGRRTYYSWCEKDPEFKAEVEEIQESLIDMVESRFYKKMLEDGDTTSMIFYLKTKGKHRGYVERQQIDQRVLNIDPSEILEKLDDKQKEQLVELSQLLDGIDLTGNQG